MLLIVKGRPPRALCRACRRLYCPAEREIEAAAKRINPAFMCPACRVEVTDRYRDLHDRECRGF